MKTLEEHNQSVPIPVRVESAPNGIACPKCGGELVDDLTKILMSDPPQTSVSCPKCGHVGSRL